MDELLRAATTISTPIALLAFVGVLILLAYRSRLQSEEKVLQSLSPEKRASHVEDQLKKYGFEVGNLTRDQKYEVLMAQMNQRNGRIRLGIICSALIFFLCFTEVVVAWKAFGIPPFPTPAPPPEEFQIESFETFADPRLPVSIFGDLADETQKRRKWMEIIEVGAEVDPIGWTANSVE
jgi:hypothetical protein